MTPGANETGRAGEERPGADVDRQRPARGDRRPERPARSEREQGSQRGARFDRGERSHRAEGFDRPRDFDRGERSGRREQSGRDDRFGRQERFGRTERDRQDRFGQRDRFDQSERPSRGERPIRGDGFERPWNERPSRTDRDERSGDSDGRRREWAPYDRPRRQHAAGSGHFRGSGRPAGQAGNRDGVTGRSGYSESRTAPAKRRNPGQGRHF